MSLSYMDVALDRSRSSAIRLEAYVLDEIEFWCRSHAERKLPLTDVPASTTYCPDLGKRVRSLIINRQCKVGQHAN